MGANIDYAIVISSHYKDLKKEMRPKQAIVEALNEAFPTIFTSGSILAGAGALIGRMTTNPIISAIGVCLSRVTLISIGLVLGVLPQILVLGDQIIERTSFELNHINLTPKSFSGVTRVQGRIRGNVNGIVEGSFDGFIRGDMEALIISGKASAVTEESFKAEYQGKSYAGADTPTLSDSGGKENQAPENIVKGESANEQTNKTNI